VVAIGRDPTPLGLVLGEEDVGHPQPGNLAYKFNAAAFLILSEEEFVRLVIISDTHGKCPDLPKGDVLLHCGDATHLGSWRELKEFAAWFKAKPHREKIFVPGNHDCAESIMLNGKERELRKFLAPIHYLRDSGVSICGVNFYGTPWVPMSASGSFTASSVELRSHFSLIPNNVHVLISHAAPYGILDVEDGEHIGSLELAHAIDHLKPRVHCFGHIHEGRGTFNNGATEFVNASGYATVVNLHVAASTASSAH
jgi:Icc-related predicted phosphoesterase